MPFTISHAVLAPSISKLTGHRLPIAALAIGCMTPDLYRLFTNADYNQSHQWSGLIFPNLLIGLFFCILWYALYRPMFFAFSGLNKPLNINNLNNFSGFILGIIFSIWVGVATHILWDGITHVDFRTFAFKEILSYPIHIFQHSYPLHRVLQIGMSAFALPILLWMIYRHHQHYRQTQAVHKNIKIYVIAVFLFSLLAGILSYLYFAEGSYSDAFSHDLYSYIGKSINYFFRAFLTTLSFGSLIFIILKRSGSIFSESST
ncbi:phospholipase [Acinetobacter defluvii]|uniref:DUF4184 family protein n=1 Tax=Acinetobacter defluvii TaxID=1871111 RepID=UPI0014903B56|nr:DUF4184 family protein [Acinetobacter defluvii]NNP72938.1 phospholipase [Acinetobacter defluvii]